MRRYDVLVVGGGYAGSMLATILASSGRRVMLADRQQHPRFAIGESSTPIADAYLARLAERYAIDAWRPLARYGDWKESYPAVRRGLKRGFSYFCHRAGQPWCDDAGREDSLLVAASSSDAAADTHWMRSDVDQMLIGVAVDHGVAFSEQTEARPLSRDGGLWKVELAGIDGTQRIEADWIVDASGDGSFSRKFFAAGSDDEMLRCRAFATFGHFTGVGRMADVAMADADWNFDPDAAAQHHVIEGGWLWLLRFDCGLSSAGLVTQDGDTPPQARWERAVRQHPTLSGLFERAECVDSTQADVDCPAADMRSSGRLARMNRRAWGPGWVSLPAAFGFVDPLHSTGIAQSLIGMGELAQTLLSDRDRVEGKLHLYEQRLRRQLVWIDRLVSLAYAGLPEPRLFVLASKAYFAAVIAQEQSDNSRGDLAESFLSCEDPALQTAVDAAIRLFDSAAASQKSVRRPEVAAMFAKHFAAFDCVGLFDPGRRNRIDHVELP